MNQSTSFGIVEMEIFSQVCSECGQSFKNGGLRIKRTQCFTCWSKGRRYRYFEELIDIYANGSIEATIRFLLKVRGNSDWIEKLDKLMEDKKHSKSEKAAIIKKIYYKLRGRDELKDRIAYKKGKRKKRWSGIIYYDECNYCHQIMEFNRNKNSFTCPHCEKYFTKIYHPTYEELEKK